MPYIVENRRESIDTSVTSSGTTVYTLYPGARPTVYDHPTSKVDGSMEHTEAQYGYRTRPGSGKTPELDLPPTNDNWSDSVSLVRHLDELERVTSTSPRGARGNYSVNDRLKTSLKSGSVVLPVDMRYSHTSGSQRWVWNGVAAVRFYLLPYTPPSFRSAAPDEPDFGKVLRDIRPNKPHAELATFVAEMGDAPRSVATTLSNLRGQKLSQGPINYQFGVAPAISEIKSLAKAVANSGSITNNFVRQSGRVIRRSRTWNEQPRDSTHVYGGTVAVPRLGTPKINFTAQITLNRTVQRIHRAGAAYQYYVADPTGFMSRAKRFRQQADHLLGSNFDAATLWELTPWSWLTDWYTDIGGLIDYQESVVEDSLVLRGGFKSTIDRVVDTYEVRVTSDRDSDPSWELSSPVKAFHVVSYERHERGKASPYAWSTDGEVTPRRASIMTALGLARVV